MAKTQVEDNEEEQTEGNEPDTTAQADGTAEYENVEQDPTDSRNEAVESGQESALDNAKTERAEQPKEDQPAGE